jgi:F-type H+-transporting ATPase subunit delta
VIAASVARRYARALLALGLEEGRHEKYGEELEAVAAALDASAEARDMVLNPGFTKAQRQGVIDTLAQGLSLSPMVVSFLRLLVDRRRIGQVDAIARAYRELVDAQVGRIRAVVTSAYPLSQEDLNRLRDTIAAAARRSIVLETKTDPSLVGGLVTQVGVTVYDGSIKTQLERMREELNRAPIAEGA